MVPVIYDALFATTSRLTSKPREDQSLSLTVLEDVRCAALLDSDKTERVSFRAPERS
jgi:hypothetical protein